MKRISAIKHIMNDVTDELIVSSCGYISREVYAIRDRTRNFYIAGAMGSAVSLSMGLALCKPNEKIISIVGDGDAMMGLDSLALLGDLQLRGELPNLKLFILKNNCYQSTGGQKCITIDFEALCSCEVINVPCSDSDVPRIPIPHEEIARRFMDAINCI